MAAIRNINSYNFSRIAKLLDTKTNLVSLIVKSPEMSDVEYTTRTSIIRMAIGLIDKEIALLEKKLNINLDKEGL